MAQGDTRHPPVLLRHATTIMVMPIRAKAMPKAMAAPHSAVHNVVVSSVSCATTTGDNNNGIGTTEPWLSPRSPHCCHRAHPNRPPWIC